VWLHAALLLLLCAMGLGLWLSVHTVKESSAPGSGHEPLAPGKQAASTITPAGVTYEDYRHAPALQDLSRQSQANTSLKGIALIMDDAGYDPGQVRRVLALPFPVAISILPDAPYARKVAEMANSHGRLVMLHLPMESVGQAGSRTGAGFLWSGMRQSEVKRLVVRALSRVPHVVGINNHMGSLLTSMAMPMRWIMELCRRRGLFFVDSRTSRETLAAAEARTAGIAWAERRVFLDHDPERLDASWRLAKRYLARDGYCVVILHPHAATLDFLERRLSRKDQKLIVPIWNVLHPAR